MRWASAVAGSTGSNGSPFSAVRSPKSAASWMRRDASARVIRNRSANAGGQFPAQLGRVGLFGELVDHRMLDGGQPAAHLLATLQYRQPLGGGQRVAPQIQRALHPGPSASKTSTTSSRPLERMFEY